MARSEMAALIARLRALVTDTDAETQTWDDDALQAALDRRRIYVNQERLTGIPTKTAAGVDYLRFESEYSDFEDGVTLEDSTFTTIAHAAGGEDLDNGAWTFDNEPARPVYLTGWAYDLYGAAADLLETETASWATSYDFSADGGSYSRSQAFKQLGELIATYRTQQKGYGGRDSHAVLIRDDVNI